MLKEKKKKTAFHNVFSFIFFRKGLGLVLLLLSLQASCHLFSLSVRARHQCRTWRSDVWFHNVAVHYILSSLQWFHCKSNRHTSPWLLGRNTHFPTVSENFYTHLLSCVSLILPFLGIRGNFFLFLLFWGEAALFKTNTPPSVKTREYIKVKSHVWAIFHYIFRICCRPIKNGPRAAVGPRGVVWTPLVETNCRSSNQAS